ncbi:MAG TPA: hypothetical protein VG456_12540 [Candidatus Sulfopaludibacter sp.]|jgi:hypothetical protein|nr:hypothetical protein [Candidatus Sulfopaludibacter sp.]
MKHYGIAEWVDFVRGLSKPGEADGMRQHLAAGCAECQGISDFCETLAKVCRGMAPMPVPSQTLQRARSIFLMKFPRPSKRSFRIPIEVIFDSFLVPAPVGLRSSWQVGWQALYHAGDCSLDLRLEPELHTCRAAIIGQVANHQAPEAEMANLPVCLKSGKVVVAETRSNRFGEFQMEYEQQKRLQLYVYLDGGTRFIQVPLKRFVVEAPVGGSRLKANAATGKKKSSIKGSKG